MSTEGTDSVVVEFYHPFAHVPGRYEWCTIHSPTHGSFDCFIVIHRGTDEPVTVYVGSDSGERFMRDRYPESTCIRVPEPDLVVSSSASGREVRARLRTDRGRTMSVAGGVPAGGQEGVPRAAPEAGPGSGALTGPLLEADVVLSADPDAVPVQVAYGGESSAVWGGRFYCEGVDLNLPARAGGYVIRADTGREVLGPGSPGIVTAGSYGRIGELGKPAR